jgi:hypothetical protein
LSAQVRQWRWPRNPSAYCELDHWRFDPRYTGGRCPICGWAPPDAPTAPGWLIVARRMDWDLFGLLALAVLLIVVGLIVAHAAGFSLPSAYFSPSGIASGARTASAAR